MAENTKIEWANHTFNPWFGCQKVGPGCDHCYAEGWAKRSGLVQWGPGADRRRSSEANWRKPIKWNRQAEIQHNAWQAFKEAHPGLTDAQLVDAGFAKPERPRVFCASLADVFDNAVPDAWRMDLFSLIAKTPYLDWLLVTKRVGNVMRMCSGDGLMFDMIADRVWLGVTICNQEEAGRDIPKLMQIPAKVRWLSMEPLLGPVDLSQWLDIIQYEDGAAWMRRNIGHLHDMLDWVVVGGESGPHARPMNPDWAYELRDQCDAADVPFLFKQWGEWATAGNRAFGTVKGEVRHIRSDGSFWGDDLPEDENADVLTVVKVGKAAAGRLLGGVQHDGYPKGGAA
jgi:protein gp37